MNTPQTAPGKPEGTASTFYVFLGTLIVAAILIVGFLLYSSFE